MYVEDDFEVLVPLGEMQAKPQQRHFSRSLLGSVQQIGETGRVAATACSLG